VTFNDGEDSPGRYYCGPQPFYSDRRQLRQLQVAGVFRKICLEEFVDHRPRRALTIQKNQPVASPYR
jgi:hypothetical protein